MQRYKVYKCKREALGLTKTQLADLAGVSSSTIGNFESGQELTQPVWRSIIWAIDNEFTKLGKEDFMKTVLATQILQLFEEEDDLEKVKTLTYIQLNASKMQLELLKK